MQNQVNEICNKISNEISPLLQKSKPLLIAIDGNCAAGKTTIAKHLSLMLSADVVHMDDFYLPLAMRSEEQMNRPGGNIDFDRLISEVLQPLSKGLEYIYRAYNCQTADFSEPSAVTPKPITVIEGAYSCHPCLENYLDYKVFVSVEEEKQLDRILKRNGEQKAMEFKTKWIPRENYYFDFFDIRNKCDIIL